MSQGDKILNYLRTHSGGLTMMEAFEKLNITKLNTRVGELIRDGYQFDKVWETHKAADGSVSRYKRYYLVEG